MKKLYFLLALSLTGCSNYPNQEDLVYRKYSLATDQAIRYMNQNYIAIGSNFRKVYSEDFQPRDNINIEYCMDKIQINNDHINPGKKFLFLESTWEINDEIPINYMAFNTCLKQQLDKEPLTRENLEVFSSDFNKNKLGEKFQPVDLKLIEVKLMEIKKDGVITVSEALQTYKLFDQISLKTSFSEF